MSRPRVVFMGTPEFAVPSLRALAESSDVVRVVTQPDRPSGRGRHSSASAVAEAAETLGLAVTKPATLRERSAVDALSAERADVFAVVAFGMILPREVLELPRAGCLNLHGSLLPDYRGASPVQRALWDGRAETGVTTLFMDEGIDTGDVVLSRREPIRPDDDAGKLAARLASIGAPLLAESVALANEGRAARTPQDPKAGSYAKKLHKHDGVVDWSLDAATVWNHARAVTPWPGATAAFRGGRLLIVRATPREGVATAGEVGRVLEVGAEGVDVACGTGVLRIERLKPEGRAEMSAAEWARGARLAPGERFESWKETVS